MDICKLTAAETASMIAEKRLSAVEVTNEYINRIKKLDGAVRSYITVCADEARKASACAEKSHAMPFEGVPVSVKDNICMAGVRTTCASKMLETYVSPYDATTVSRLKNNNIPILGKTNMDEFAMGSFGVSSAFFQTQNPLDNRFVPGGSSGGSAASVAAGLACASVGTDTGGSVRIPAAFCGLVGFKPTYGAISRFGLIAYASSLDTIGLITKTVDDAILISSVLFGRDDRDMTSIDVLAVYNGEVDFNKITFACSEQDLIGADKDIQSAISRVWSVLSHLGAKRLDATVFANSRADEAYTILACAEASSNLARYDGIKYGATDGKNAEEVRQRFFGDEVKRRINFGNTVLNEQNFDKLYTASVNERARVMRELDMLFEKADVIVSPLHDFIVPEFSETASCRADRFTVAANFAGIPAISIPVGRDGRGMPISVQLMSKKCSDAKLLVISKKLCEVLREEGLC